MDVIERFADAYWAQHERTMRLDQRKALQAILQCRTSVLGGNCYACPDCGNEHFAYHSCNHRLCPQCGAADTQEWVDKQLGKLLPVPYFMVTFTLPEQLRPVLFGNRLAMDLFARCSSQALAKLLADPKHTGFVRNGFFGVFQSWTQEMHYHPHFHYIVPAVGLDTAGKLKHLKRPDFLIYAQALANRLRTLLANALREGGLIEAPLFWQLVKMDWNASVDPAGTGANAVKYLGQYVQHSVISDSRVLAIEGQQVRIRIKNRDTDQFEERVMQGVEFIRRFLLHALPTRFHRIRYRGFMHARGKPMLQWLQILLDARIPRPLDKPKPSVTGYSCARCGSIMHKIKRMPRAPPAQRNEHFFHIVAA